MSRRSKVRVKETDTPALNPLAQDLKSAIDVTNSVIPAEHVFRTNINCKHQKWTNKYFFNYPGEWRTITNQQLFIGIRAVYYKPASHRFFQIIIKYYKDSQLMQEFWYQEFFNTNSKLILRDVCNKINEWHKNEVEPITNCVLLCDVGVDNKTTLISLIKSKVGTVWYEFTNISQDFQTAFNITSDKLSFKDEHIYINPLTWNILNDDELEVTASFVNQTEFQHLGYTGITYNPLKYYKINSSDTEFYIELWTKDGNIPALITEDGHDVIVIEATLTTKPLK